MWTRDSKTPNVELPDPGSRIPNPGSARHLPPLGAANARRSRSIAVRRSRGTPWPSGHRLAVSGSRRRWASAGALRSGRTIRADARTRMADRGTRAAVVRTGSVDGVARGAPGAARSRRGRAARAAAFDQNGWHDARGARTFAAVAGADS